MTHEHVIEIYAFAASSIGELRTRFQLNAADSRAAGEAALKRVARDKIAAVYQGTLDHQGRRPVGFVGGYTLAEWAELRDVFDGADGVLRELQRRSLAAREQR